VIKYENYIGIGILVVTLMAFSGFASAASVTNQGSAISHHNSTSQTLEHWYISSNGPVSTIVFVANMQTKSNGTWKHFLTVQYNEEFKPLPHNMMQINSKGYINGKQISSDSNVFPHKHTALYDARISLSGIINSYKFLFS
jgi:hypothetical protein